MKLVNFEGGDVEPIDKAPLPERVIAGNPKWRSWIHYSDSGIVSGRWQSTPGTWKVIHDKWEFFSMLEGQGTLRSDDGQEVRLEPGVTVVLIPGFKGLWEVTQMMRKNFFTREASWD